MPAPAPAFLPVPGSVQGQGKLQSQSQFQSQSQSQFQFQGHALDPAGGPDRHHRPHVHPHPHLHSSAAGTGAYVHPLARVVSEDEEGGETPVQAKFAASTTAKFTTSASNKKFTTSTSNKFATSTSSASDMRVQLPTPPESGSSSGESVVDEEVGDAEEEGDDSESTARAGDGEVTPPAQQSKPKPDMWIDTDPTTPTTTTLARRPTRNHRPAPPPPSVPSPVRAALETLAMSPKDAAPPAMIVVDASAASAIPTTSIAAGVGASIVAAAAIVGASAVAAQPTPPSAFPAMKGSVGISEHLTNMEEARPARPRTVHVSDAQRRAPPMLGGSASVGAGGNGSGGVGGLHRTASQSTSALLRGSGGKAAAGVSELGEKSGNGTGKEKGYAHGLQAAWRKIAVWRGGREKGALRG
ncbi:hypothetical protein BDN70DRAFT_880764 [Pholiota conissans]|uniref:Uncharacterized protein n=1 Tax=Pholiota conissans TaxID=109636 RepID=A0A9P5YZ23_9AGAR|nr:hypothetical protein BDN70DRAFT_880764 [Pholiota conissans]